MTDCIVFTEEPSARIVLEELAKRVAPNKSFIFVEHQGKNDLRESMARKIPAWRHPPDVKFVVIHDKDGHPNCISLKSELYSLIPSHVHQRTRIRIAMPCLESWYLADPHALSEAGLIDETKAKRMTRSAKFRHPERLSNAKQEFLKLHQETGQIKLARQISPFLNVERSVSPSFRLVASTLQTI